MARRKKPAGQTSGARRSARRAKKGQQSTDDASATSTVSAEVLEPAESTAPVMPEGQQLKDDPKPPASSEVVYDSQPSTDSSAIKKSATWHKNFGKFRFLFNNDDNMKACGSDSETISIEIRVVDPCASSESDSNAALDGQTDTSISINLSPTNSTSSAIQTYSTDVSPSPTISLTMANEIQEHEEAKLSSTAEPNIVPTDDQLLSVVDNTVIIDNIQEPHNNPIIIDSNDLEEEIITVVQIVEDDNQELYYDIKMDSSKHSPLNIETSADEKDVSGFQKTFELLHLNELNTINSPVQNVHNISICETPESFIKDSTVEIIPRPDPSITPSSTLSDDSNSSKVPSELNHPTSNDSAESSPTGIRRSNRIKIISNLKQKTKGYGLVKTPLKKALMSQTKLKLEEMSSDTDKNLTDTINNMPNSPSFPVPSEMPVKVKSRWRRSSELEMNSSSPVVSPLASPSLPHKMPPIEEDQGAEDCNKDSTNYDKIIEERMNQYQHLDENEYLCDRMISRDTKKMICDCFLTKEEIERGELGCGEDCLNRLLMIECNYRCPVGDRCTNRRFQKVENGPLRVFFADKKGCGVEACVDIPPGEFLMEYVGEVLDYDKFYERALAYSSDNNLHHYFMSLKGDTVIDATVKGNISRFINHSCDPNAETQKWTVNGELRIGFFSKRDIKATEEITFDYQFQRFGKIAQRCYCGADNCRGWIGAEPDSEDEEEEEEEEDDVSTSKTDIQKIEQVDESGVQDEPREMPQRPKRPPRPRRRYTVRPKPELEMDADIEDDIEALTRTGIKNQSHTLLLSRTMVRAKSRRAQTLLLRLLRDADLPCRRLFLDYRGLRLLAPWCADAPLDFRLEMLLTVDRLPITNKTMVQESRFFTIVERWLSGAADQQPPVFDEATGLPIEMPNRQGTQDSSAEKTKENVVLLQKVKDLSKQMLERWSSLKEVFKIPKKERIQQMKEHERQANVERRAADSSGSRDRDRDRERREDRDRERERDRERDRDRERERERERERYKERERERERDRERDRDRDRDDRDRRKRRCSPEGRRSIRLSDRVLASVPPMTKEERRRAFAEAAAAAEQSRRQPEPPSWPYPQWPPDSFPPQMFPPGMMGGPPPGVLPPLVPPVLGVVPDGPPEWLGPDFPGFCPPFCMPQPNFMGMSGFPMGGFMYPPQMNPPFPQPQPPMEPAQLPIVAVKPEVPASDPPNAEVQTEEVELPSQWRSARDTRGRLYYYHVKLRIPQWLPPPPPKDESSSEEEKEDPVTPQPVRRRRKGKLVEGVNGIYEVMIKEETQNGLIPDHALVNIKTRKRRPGLVTERPISPRTEEDKLAGRLEVKRYRETKEKLRKRRERLLQRVRLLDHHSAKRPRRKHIKVDEIIASESESDSSEEVEEQEQEVTVVETPEEEVVVVDPAETARRIKEEFRCSMARVMVQHLNPYRHPSAPVARITCTADFKHLARKLTHFVLLKELRHCRAVEDLVCTDSVRSKAKEFVKKYMAKFGSVYTRPPEEVD